LLEPEIHLGPKPDKIVPDAAIELSLATLWAC
jgi:hypothetical protein